MNIESTDPRLNPRRIPAVLDARNRYEQLRTRPPGRFANTEFDTLLDWLLSNCMTLTQIGERIGVSRERVRQVYNTFFKDLLPPSMHTPRSRRRVCTIVKHRLTERDLRYLSPETAELRSVLLDAGLNPELIVNSERYPRHKRLMVNNKVLAVHVPDSWKSRAKHRYYRFRVWSSDIDFAVVPFDGDWYVYALSDLQLGVYQYIPQNWTDYYVRSDIIEHRQEIQQQLAARRNAWHLISGSDGSTSW